MSFVIIYGDNKMNLNYCTNRIRNVMASCKTKKQLQTAKIYCWRLIERQTIEDKNILLFLHENDFFTKEFNEIRKSSCN